jgi:small subunit ribosomal protein S13
MVFLLNLNIKETKNIYITIKYCYGISTKVSLCLLSKFGINKFGSYKTIPEFIRIQFELNLDKLIEYVFKLKIGRALVYTEENFYNKLLNLKIYRALRHKQYLPVRGQRTHSNAKTQKRKLKNRLKILKANIKVKK